jgi:uncharacterized protein
VIPIQQHAQGAVFNVRVVPNASRDAIEGTVGDAVKVRLRAPPADGKANRALAEVLAERLGIRPRDVILLAGETARTKRVLVKGLSAATAADLLPSRADR